MPKQLHPNNGKEFAHHAKINKALGVCFILLDPITAEKEDPMRIPMDLSGNTFLKELTLGKLHTDKFKLLKDILNNRLGKRLHSKSLNTIFK